MKSFLLSYQLGTLRGLGISFHIHFSIGIGVVVSSHPCLTLLICLLVIQAHGLLNKLIHCLVFKTACYHSCLEFF